MKKINSLPVMVLIVGGLSLFIVFLVMQPARLSVFNLSTDDASNIGSALGGILGPVVGVYSIFLLNETLVAQRKGLDEQRNKAATDVYFLLLNQLQQDYDRFATTYKERPGAGRAPEDKVEFGYKALLKFIWALAGQSDEAALKIFSEDPRSDDVLTLIRSYNLIEEYLKLIDDREGFRTLLERRLNLFYSTKLKTPLDILSSRIGHLEDPLAREIREFVRVRDAS